MIYRRYRKTEAPTLAQARNARAAELVRVEQSKVLGFAPLGEETFAEVGDRYLTYQKARLTPKAYEREEFIIRLHLKPFLKGKLSTIRRTDIQRYITSRAGKPKASPYSIQKEVNVIKHMFRLAVEWEIIPFSPAQGIKGIKVPAGRVRDLQPTELKVLIEAAPEWLRPIIAIAMTTGMRHGEIISLRWLVVDITPGRVMLPQTKNGDGRIVYLNQSAQAVFRALPVDGHTTPIDQPLPFSPDQVTIAFRRACVKAKISDFPFS